MHWTITSLEMIWQYTVPKLSCEYNLDSTLCGIPNLAMEFHHHICGEV